MYAVTVSSCGTSYNCYHQIAYWLIIAKSIVDSHISAEHSIESGDTNLWMHIMHMGKFNL
jgi:uncharacterized protein YwlG (UPF0340 family)